MGSVCGCGLEHDVRSDGKAGNDWDGPGGRQGLVGDSAYRKRDDHVVLELILLARCRLLVIAASSQPDLTVLNAAIRRTSLLIRLLSPLLASAIITAFGYSTSVLILLAYAIVSAAVEWLWIGVIWDTFPALAEDELLRERRRAAAPWDRDGLGVVVAQSRMRQRERTAWSGVVSAGQGWVEFAQMPIFLSKHIRSTVIAVSACWLNECLHCLPII